MFPHLSLHACVLGSACGFLRLCIENHPQPNAILYIFVEDFQRSFESERESLYVKCEIMFIAQ